MNSFNKLYILLAFLFTLLSVKGLSQDSAVVSKIKFLTKKAESYLDKEKALSPYFSIDGNGISIYESYAQKLKGKSEFHISWDNIDDFKLCFKTSSVKEVFEIYTKGDYNKAIPCSAQSSFPEFVSKKEENGINEPPFMFDQIYLPKIKKLKGLKIAIDAGHTAGDMETGILEKKCLTFQCNGIYGQRDTIAIAEGILTFATAKLLKDKLEAEGAEVFLTRPFNGSTAYGVTFDNWLKTDYKSTVDELYRKGKLSLQQKQFFLSPKASKSDKFRVVFKDAELQKRAEIINNFKPDFTIIIHFNVDETNTGWTRPANKNFNMAFVGGAFMKNDLSTPEKRFEFLRLLISDDLEKSIALSAAMVKSFEGNLNVKTAGTTDAKYLIAGCLPTNESGVYCRNLQLTRYVHGPLVYGETLYQDNMDECFALNKESDKTKNPRVQQVAEAYFQGVLNYIIQQR